MAHSTVQVTDQKSSLTLMVNILTAIHGDLRHTFLNRQINLKNQPSYPISITEFSVNVQVENEYIIKYSNRHLSSHLRYREQKLLLGVSPSR